MALGERPIGAMQTATKVAQQAFGLTELPD